MKNKYIWLDDYTQRDKSVLHNEGLSLVVLPLNLLIYLANGY